MPDDGLRVGVIGKRESCLKILEILMEINHGKRVKIKIVDQFGVFLVLAP